MSPHCGFAYSAYVHMVFIYVLTYVRTCTYMYVHTCIILYVCISTYKWLFSIRHMYSTNAYICTYVHRIIVHILFMYMCCSNLRLNIRAGHHNQVRLLCTCIHTYICTYINSCFVVVYVRTYVRKYTYVHVFVYVSYVEYE